MNRNCRLIMIEEDLFAKLWIKQCVAAEPSIKLVAWLTELAQLKQVIRKTQGDVILIDYEKIDLCDWPTRLISAVRQLPGVKVVLMGTRIDETIFREIDPAIVKGYILKQEVEGDLTQIVLKAADNYWVMTPQILTAARKHGFVPQNLAVVSTGFDGY